MHKENQQETNGDQIGHYSIGNLYAKPKSLSRKLQNLKNIRKTIYGNQNRPVKFRKYIVKINFYQES